VFLYIRPGKRKEKYGNHSHVPASVERRNNDPQDKDLLAERADPTKPFSKKRITKKE
jgi:hypothetical protein